MSNKIVKVHVYISKITSQDQKERGFHQGWLSFSLITGIVGHRQREGYLVFDIPDDKVKWFMDFVRFCTPYSTSL